MEGFAGFGDEFPIVGGGVEGQLEDAEGVGVSDFASGQRISEGAMVFAAGAGVSDFASGQRISEGAMVFAAGAGDESADAGRGEKILCAPTAAGV